jgi:DNA-binding NarL/FixJ family response regulator
VCRIGGRNELPRPPALPPVRGLFVENHEVFARTVFEYILADHEVTHVTTVAGAKATMSQDFDAALVDDDLPNGKGVDVVRALRAMHVRGSIVAVSSRDEGNDELRTAGAATTCQKADFRSIATALEGVTVCGR